MDEIRNTLAKIYNALEAWAEFGVLWLAVMIFLPYAVTIGALLISLPFILFFFGLSSPWFLAIYVFAVMAVVALYCYRKYVYGDDPDTPIAGRPIISEERAARRSRSIMRNAGKRKR